jgi:hypothetical protein
VEKKRRKEKKKSEVHLKESACLKACLASRQFRSNFNYNKLTNPHKMRQSSPTIPAKRKSSSEAEEDMSSVGPPSKTRKRVPAEIWETKRPIITRLYQEEKRSLKEVMEIMERDYKFVAT